MKRVAVLTGVLVLVMACVVAFAHGTEEHGHVLLVDAQFVDGQLVDFGRCVDLAGGRALRNNAHHDGIHTGRAGEALRTRAGHLVVPTFAFDGCTELEAFFRK